MNYSLHSLEVKLHGKQLQIVDSGPVRGSSPQLGDAQAGGAGVSRRLSEAVAREEVASVPAQARAEVPIPAPFPAWRIEVEVADE